MDKKLLDILCCPVTKQPIKLLSQEKLDLLNQTIEQGSLTFADDGKVDKPLAQALVTMDESIVYPVEQDIPLMIQEKGIRTSQVSGWSD